VALALARLPRYLVLEPVSTVRFEVQLARPASEIDVALETPRPGRSFLLLIGPQGGPVLQRLRLSGRARVVFRPRDDRPHLLMLANPQQEPLVLRLSGRALRGRRRAARRPLTASPMSRLRSTPALRRRPARLVEPPAARASRA